MPWENGTVQEQREAFAEAARHSGNFSALCRAYGITRKTGYKWVKRYEEGEILADRNREPHSIAHKTPPGIEAERFCASRAIDSFRTGYGNGSTTVVFM